MNQSFLITGASGFLGYHLAKTLLEKGIKVIAIKRPNSKLWRYENLSNHNLKFYNVENLESAFKENNITCIMHTACSYGRNGQSLMELIDANIIFGLKVLEMAKKYKILTFFNADTLLSKNINNYALTKHQFSQWLKRDLSQTQIFNMKIEHMYGIKDDNNKLIAWLINELINNATQINLTACLQKRDFVYIDDVVRAYLAVYDNKNSFGKFAEFDVGTGEQIVLKEFLLEIYKQCKARFNFNTILKFGAKQMRENEAMEIIENVEPLKNLGWMAQNNYKHNISLIIDYYCGGGGVILNALLALNPKSSKKVA